MKLTTLIVDDEKIARENLISELEIFDQTIHVIGQANSVITAVDQINLLKPQLVFLDVNLGDGLAFDVLEQIEHKRFKLVFLTAYDQYALRAFKVNALDYLLKPLNREELKTCVEKITGSELSQLAYLDQLLDNLKQQKPRKIAIPSQDGFALYEIAEIIRCQSDGNYTIIYFTDKRHLLSSKTLKYFEDTLDGLGFERVHNSHMVNVDHIRKYQNTDGGILKMSDDSEVPISQRKKSYVISVLENL